jgi:hypothetical protein
MVASLLEAVAVLGVPAVLALALIARIARPYVRLGAASLAIATWALASLTVAKHARAVEPPRPDRPLVLAANGYTGSASCKACHPGHYSTWHDSYHRTMTQLPTPETVRGDWSGVALVLSGAAHRFERANDAFVYVEPGGARHEIALLTGSHRMQVAWYATGRTRTLAQVPFVWLIEENRWAPRNAAFLRPPEVSAHPPSEEGRWNNTCLRCHSTDPHARVAGPESDTRVGELGISCEACHGPGEAHVRANEDPRRRYELHLRREGDPTIVNPARLSAERSREVCGQCHSVSAERSRADWEKWNREGFTFRPGDTLSETREVIRYRSAPDDDLTRQIFALDPTFMENRFWKDGMLRVTGRELSALLETPCAVKGKLTCLHCHSVHQEEEDARPPRAWADRQIREVAGSDRVCATCHDAVVAQGTRHTHHAGGTTTCASCHMPRTTYGLQRAIESHRISVPSARESHEVGRPNACNLCHLDRTLAWTAERLGEWFRTPRPELTKDETEIASGHLWLLSGDAGQRALVAAAAGEAFTADLAQLLDDPYESVRLLAWRSLRPRFPTLDYDFLGPPEARLAARAKVLERSPSKLDPSTFERLLHTRNDRPVDLSE